MKRLFMDKLVNAKYQPHQIILALDLTTLRGHLCTLSCGSETQMSANFGTWLFGVDGFSVECHDFCAIFP